MWVTGTAPTGWLICDGTEQLISSYPTLSGVLGTTYGTQTNGSGGAGTTHFRLPDLRGRVPMGAGQGRNVAGNANLPSTRTLGAKVSDDETVAITEAQMPAHRHNNTRNTQTIGSVGSPVYALVNQGDFSEPDITTITGGGQAHNNTQPSTVINFIIKF
jgi:microcystin-dependent protein